jgi:hypothetical protein
MHKEYFLPNKKEKLILYTCGYIRQTLSTLVWIGLMSTGTGQNGGLLWAKVREFFFTNYQTMYQAILSY